ncbi:cobalt-precorrin-6A reductase [Microlunatus ginsengisoli]|uniref:cobalt-precorrin-6A reductase n=1 Tax=Microlunatus ginsengisoli TaxID=363863 RepID=UPI0031D1CB62
MILILGGTSEARALAAALVDRGDDVLSSLAGRVGDPALPAGRVRVGGFGGIAGLTSFLIENRVEAVIDATHPFAAEISANAAAATAATGSPLIRLVRPSWRGRPESGAWTWVDSVGAVLDVAPDAARPFLTTGRQSLAVFLPWADRGVVARVVDPPELDVPPAWTILRSRGPYALAGERDLMRRHAVDLLVTKDSGGTLTEAKLAAAADLGIPIVVVARPPSAAGLATVADVLAALHP